MQVCDWRDHDRLTALLRELLARAARTGEGRDWRDAQLCGLMLTLREDEMAQIRRISIATIGQRLPTTIAPFAARRSGTLDGRIHVGLAVPSLRDPRVANALQRQLALHDHDRFAIHVYSPTPQPDPAVTSRISEDCAGQNMASRLGGSIVRAAGLADCVFASRSAFIDSVVRLGRDTAALAALRAELAGARADAPLFDARARLREWESAWQTMVQRHADGLPPAAFDVPEQPPTPRARGAVSA